MHELPLNIPRYPMLRWITRWGGSLATVAAVVAALTGMVAGAQSSSLVVGLAGLAGGAVLFVVLRALVEMVRLITDMLLPK